MPDPTQKITTPVGPIAVETAAAVINAILTPVHPEDAVPPTVLRIATVISQYANADGMFEALREIAGCNDLLTAREIARRAIASVEAKSRPQEARPRRSLAVH